MQALRAIYQPGYNYLKTGVRATGIIPAGEVQFNLFSSYDNSKLQALSGLMDDINARYGRAHYASLPRAMTRPENEAGVFEQAVHH